MMHLTCVSMCICATLCRSTYAAPVAIPFNITSDALSKRAPSGPALGGVNFPDPSIIQVNGIWYSFATRTRGSKVKIQVARSDDFDLWGLYYNQDGTQYDAMPNLPPWVHQQEWNTWAPDIVQLADGTFLMYYSASLATDVRYHCVGVATAKSVLGPYIPQNRPMICPLSQGGAIDAAGYEENGQRYVLYKVDGNAIGNGGACGNTVAPIVPTPIVLQRVAADGYTLQGIGTSILDNIGPSDDGVVEAPHLVRSGNTWILFFSSGCFVSTRYTVEYATASSISGPYERASRPLFRTGDRDLKAPGGMAVWKDGRHMVFHADWAFGRALHTAILTIAGGQVAA